MPTFLKLMKLKESEKGVNVLCLGDARQEGDI